MFFVSSQSSSRIIGYQMVFDRSSQDCKWNSLPVSQEDALASLSTSNLHPI